MVFLWKTGSHLTIFVETAKKSLIVSSDLVGRRSEADDLKFR